MTNEFETPAVEDQIEDTEAETAETEHGMWNGGKREWVRGAILAGLTIGAIVIASLPSPTTVSGTPM